MLYNGERIGDGSPPEVDIAVDPLEGTRLTAQRHALGAGGDRAVGAGHDVRPGAVRVHGEARRRARDRRLLSLTEPLPEVIRRVAERKGVEVGDVTVIMLDRPRHADAVAEIREAARGSGSSPTATSPRRCSRSRRGPASTCCGGSAAPPRACSRRRRSSASAASCSGRLWPRDDDERRAAVEAGYDLDEVLDVDRLVAGTDVFFAATGVTDGDLLQGVRYLERRPRDHRVAGHALTLGHGPHGAGTTRPAEAARGHRRALRVAGGRPAEGRL